MFTFRASLEVFQLLGKIFVLNTQKIVTINKGIKSLTRKGHGKTQLKKYKVVYVYVNPRLRVVRTDICYTYRAGRNLLRGGNILELWRGKKVCNWLHITGSRFHNVNNNPMLLS